MTDVDALTAFIRARIDEEERDAKAATHDRGRWRAVPAHYGDALLIEADDVQVMADREMVGFAGDADVCHAVRQDPAATLARVAALRALLGYLDAQEKLADSTGRLWRHNMIDESRSHLAAIWRDHPDHQPEWVTSE